MESYTQNIYDFSIPEIINIINIETDASWELKNLITDDHWILSYSLMGEADYYWDGKSHRIKKGDLLFFQQGFARSARSLPQDPWKFIVMKFKLDMRNEYTSKMLSQIPNIIHIPKYAHEYLFGEAADIWKRKRTGYTIKCRSILLSLLYDLIQHLELSSRSSRHYSAIEKVLLVIDENIKKNFSVEQLAEIARMSPSYFRSVFKSYTGYSVVEYQNYIKIAKARDLLLTGNYNVSEVAEMVGISDNYYFSRLYKRITGTTPSRLLDY